MLDAEFTIRNAFPPADYDQWRTLAEAALRGAPLERKLVTRSYEGIAIQPIYTRQDLPDRPNPQGFPGLPPFVRGSRPLGSVATGWDLRQVHAHPDLDVANRQIVADIQGGVSSLLVRLDHTARNGQDIDDPAASELGDGDGLLAFHVDDWDTVLTDVPLDKVGVTLDPGAAFLPAAAMLTALWQRRGIEPDLARGSFGADPLGTLARDGQLPFSTQEALREMSDLARWTASQFKHVTAVNVNTSVYHHAGATAVQDIAMAMATAVEYLRSMTRAGMDTDSAAGQFLFTMSLGTHHFLSIAKLRAARRLWQRVIEASGGSAESAAMRIHTRTSDRVLTRRDPYVNLLRNTVAVFSAGIAGADAITSVPLDHRVGLPDDFSRRIARNTGLILQEEAHLNRVLDAAGGSWLLDTLTDQVAEAGWGLFQDIEREGGMLAVLENGWLAGQIDAAYAPRAAHIACRKQGITGISEFPNLGEEPLVSPPCDTGALRKAAIDRIKAARVEQGSLMDTLRKLAIATDLTTAAVTAAAEGATMGQLARTLGFHQNATQIPPLEPHCFAEPFETLRDASDAWQATHGQRARVFLAKMGPVAHHTARAGYSKNFFEAGGFEVVEDDGFQDADAAAAALAASGAAIAVICSSNKLYPNVVPELAPRLKAAGARSVILAGHPGDMEKAWREAGVDRFIFVKCDVLGVLSELLREEGVLTS